MDGDLKAAWKKLDFVHEELIRWLWFAHPRAIKHIIRDFISLEVLFFIKEGTFFLFFF